MEQLTVDTVLEKLWNDLGVRATRTTRLETLGLDSLELLEFLHELDIPNIAIDDLETIGDCADYLTARSAR
jgi:acyl carrier protein